MQNNAQEVEVRLKNPDKQLDPESDTIRQSVEYISKGGGNLVLKGDDRRRVLYSSQASVVTETLSHDVQVEEGNAELLRTMAQQLFQKRDPTAKIALKPDK